jgi:hypothetical protein
LLRKFSFGSAVGNGNASDEMAFVEPELIRLRELYGYFIVTFNNIEGSKPFTSLLDAADIF